MEIGAEDLKEFYTNEAACNFFTFSLMCDSPELELALDPADPRIVFARSFIGIKFLV